MSTRLAELLSRIGPDADWNLALWAGVGYGADVPVIRKLGARRTIYVEPHADLHARLASRLKVRDDETLLPIALWSTDGTVPFHKVSDPLHSSLLRPERLLMERPNLRIVSDEAVRTCRLQDVCSNSDMATCRNLLILDVCGAEREILAGAPEDLLAAFSVVVVRSDTLHVPDGGEADVAARLTAIGFAVEERGPGSDGWRLFINQAHMHATTGQAGGQRLEWLARPTESESRSHADAARTSHSSLEAELEILSSERDEAARQLQALQMQAEERQSELATLEATNLSLAAERDALAVERDEAGRHAQQLRQQLDEAMQVRQELEQQLGEARQTVTLSVRLQSQHQADLRDLQERYRESQEVQERQRQLLARLSERLGVASHYFHRLADEREAQVASASIDDADRDQARERKPAAVAGDKKKANAPRAKPGRAKRTPAIGDRSAGNPSPRGRGSKTER